jgi:hypothetical protein
MNAHAQTLQGVTLDDIWAVLTRLDRQVQELRERRLCVGIIDGGVNGRTNQFQSGSGKNNQHT